MSWISPLTWFSTAPSEIVAAASTPEIRVDASLQNSTPERRNHSLFSSYDNRIPLLSQRGNELVYYNGNLYNEFKDTKYYRYTCNCCHQGVLLKEIDISTGEPSGAFFNPHSLKERRPKYLMHKPTCEKISEIDLINKKATQQFANKKASGDYSNSLWTKFLQSLQNPAVTSEEYVARRGWLDVNKNGSDQIAYRKKRRSEPVEPTDVKNIDFQDKTELTHVLYNGIEQPFLIFNAYSDEFNGSIVGFSTILFLQLLFEVHRVFFDGTFKSCANIFNAINGQYWCIHFLYLNLLLTGLHSFLPGKSKAIYKKV